MGNISVNIAVATAVAGYDLLTNEPEARQAYARVIKWIGVVGSAALGDILPELIVGGTKQGKFNNTTAGVSASNAGACLIDRDLKAVDIFVPANAQVQMVMNTAATTNAVKVEIQFERPARRAFYGRARGGATRGGGVRRTTAVRRSGMF